MLPYVDHCHCLDCVVCCLVCVGYSAQARLSGEFLMTQKVDTNKTVTGTNSLVAAVDYYSAGTDSDGV